MIPYGWPGDPPPNPGASALFPGPLCSCLPALDRNHGPASYSVPDPTLVLFRHASPESPPCPFPDPFSHSAQYFSPGPVPDHPPCNSAQYRDKLPMEWVYLIRALPSTLKRLVTLSCESGAVIGKPELYLLTQCDCSAVGPQ